MVYSFNALGTAWWLTLFEEPETADVICSDIRRFVNTFEQRYSRFKADSLVSTLNRERVLLNPDEECRALLQYGKQLYLRSNCVFNMLTGHILEARGYDADYSFHDTSTGKEADLVPGDPISDLLIDDQTVVLKRGNLDLGGFGKGYLIDLIADRLKTEHEQIEFLINGGGDMFGTLHQGKAIEIYLEHPTRPGTAIGTTSLSNQGFAASSPHKRQWTSQSGTTHTHIVGALETSAIFLTAPSAVDADAFATTLLQVDQPTARQLAADNNLTIL